MCYIYLMRDNHDLDAILDELISANFREILSHRDFLSILFGRKARTRLGSIKQSLGQRMSIITINGLFKNDEYPTEIIKATIAHELCHFVHGFSSPLPQLSTHPHLGGVVDKELMSRGLGDLLSFQKKWLKIEWQGVVQSNFKATARRRRRVRYIRWF